MHKREFIKLAGAAGVAALAGCAGDSSGQTETDDGGTATANDSTPVSDGTVTTDEQPTDSAQETPQRYFFRDEAGTLGHLGDQQIPPSTPDWQVVTNTLEEPDWREIQTNDEFYPNHLNGHDINMSVDQMIQRTREIYENPTVHFDMDNAESARINIQEEDDEITFTRAIVKAGLEAGVTSSGLANAVMNNFAEAAVEQINPGFVNYKLSTLPSTEPINPNSTGAAGNLRRENDYRQVFVNSGFVHMPGLLQYQKGKNQQIKYVEVTQPLITPLFRKTIRSPEESMYRENLDQDTVSNSVLAEPGDSGSMFPEHYVTALDYTKARQLESQDAFGFHNNGNEEGLNAVGDRIAQTLLNMVDDIEITGYGLNQDLDLSNYGPLDGMLVSDSFGESLENYVINPTIERNQYVENIARGLFQIQQQKGWGTSVAFTGTIETPELLPTDQETVDQVRRAEAYDEVRERVLA